MTLIAVLLALQEPPPQEPLKQSQFVFGPILEYWFPRFKGDMRMDGSTTPGTNLKFHDDLNLPDHASIPIYGGGAIGAQMNKPSNERINVTGVAEYWTHAWKGGDILQQDTTFGDRTFFTGTGVNSRFTLTSVTLDFQIAYSTDLFTLGADVAIQVSSARMRITSATAEAKESIDDVYWGGGFFVDVRPLPFVLGGFSVKGFTSFGDAGETGAGDFRIFGGAEYGPFRLEGGFRAVIYDHNLPTESLSYALHGAYVQFSFLWRF